MALSARDRKMLEGVHPDLVRVVERAARECPIPFRVTDGVRTIERQAELVAKGASQTMNSKHLPQADGYSHAVDLAPYVDIDGDGKVTTNEMYAWPVYYRLAPQIKAAAKAEGVALVWGGDWKNFKDGPHWELRPPWKFAALFGSYGDVDYPYREDTVLGSRTVQASAGIGGAALGMLGSMLAGMDALTVAVLAVAVIAGLAIFVGRERIQKMIDARLG